MGTCARMRAHGCVWMHGCMGVSVRERESERERERAREREREKETMTKIIRVVSVSYVMAIFQMVC